MAHKRSIEDTRANRLSHLLWEVSQRTALLGEAELAEQGLTFAAVGLLDAVSHSPGITAAEIARRSPKTPQAVSQVASRLEKLGYVERRLATGRGVGLHITPEGEKLLARGDMAEQEFDARLRELLGEPLYTQLRALLHETRPILRDA